MRQRGVKNREQILTDCAEYIAADPKEQKGRWAELFGGAENGLFLEIGSGKGQFIASAAKNAPEGRFLGCEGGENIYIRILQKAKERNLQNLRVICCYIDDPLEFFEPGELSGIYINFCDPWPKARHEHRRLTHRNKLEAYRQMIRKGGFLQFKTDNDALFEWSLEEFEACGLTPSVVCRDLWNSPYAEGNIRTEYESKFGDKGKTINMARIDF